jgi:hypothetical protein
MFMHRPITKTLDLYSVILLIFSRSLKDLGLSLVISISPGLLLKETTNTLTFPLPTPSMTDTIHDLGLDLEEVSLAGKRFITWTNQQPSPVLACLDRAFTNLRIVTNGGPRRHATCSESVRVSGVVAADVAAMRISARDLLARSLEPTADHLLGSVPSPWWIHWTRALHASPPNMHETEGNSN